MKKFLLLFPVLLLFFSCEEVVTIDLPSAETRLVIDATAQKLYNLDNEVEEENTFVKLSLTADFYDTEITFVNDANVSITNLSTNTTYQLTNFDVNNNGEIEGEYLIITNNFEIEDDTEYLLRVEYNNEIYESIETLNPSVPVDNLEQFKNTSSFNSEDLKLKISFTDLEEPDNFYIIAFDDYNYVTLEDTFIDNENPPFSFDYFYEASENSTLTASIWGSDSAFNTYVDAVVELADGGQNGPFSTVPYEIRGNIVNTTNSDNYPYGYFRIHETYYRSVELVSNDEAPEEEE